MIYKTNAKVEQSDFKRTGENGLNKKAVRLGKNTISSASFLKLHTEYQDSFFLHRYTGSLLINLLTRQKI